MQEYIFENRIYYRTNEFKLGRPTLIFIHGLSGSSSAWIPYEGIFKDKYNLLAFDIRGHGKSKKYPNYSDYEIKKFVEDMNILISYLKIPKFALISHSFGTLIAAEYIKSHGEKVLLNIFLSPIFGLEKDFKAKIARPILQLSNIFKLLPFKPKSGKQIDYSKMPHTTDWSPKRCYADVSNTTLRVYLYCLRQSMLPKQEYYLDKIKIPTLIVHGLKDTMVPAKNSITLSKIIQNSELVLIPNTDHIVVLNNTEEISQTIESFIKRKNLLS